MARQKRATPDAFGTSMLDMMTCVLGSVILIFVLKTAVDQDRLAETLNALVYEKKLHDTVEGQVIASKKEFDDTLKDLKHGAKGTVFGFPPISGAFRGWRRTHGYFRTFGSKIIRGIERANKTDRLSGSGVSVNNTPAELHESLNGLAKSGFAKATVATVGPPYAYSVTDSLEDVIAAIDDTMKSMTPREREKQLTYHRVTFILKEDLQHGREKLRYHAIVHKYLANQFNGIFLAIPVEPPAGAGP